MSEIQRYIKDKTTLLKRFLELTEKIDELFKSGEAEEKFLQMQMLVDKREEIITSLKEINADIEKLTKGNQEALKKEYETQIAFWVDLLGRIKILEESNKDCIEKMTEKYMDRVRTTKDSIKMLGAYQKQISFDKPANIDKRN